jgi:hypothetical protein
VADLAAFPQHSLSELLESAHVSFERIAPDLAVRETLFVPEPEREAEAPEEPPPRNPALPESQALIRIWRKQKQDPYNRETLLGVGLMMASSGNASCFGPLVCYRVRPEYNPEHRVLSMEKVSSTPFLNLTLLGKVFTAEDDLADIRPALNDVICSDDFGEAHLERLAKILSGASETLKKLRYVRGALRSLAQLDALSENELPVLSSGAVVLNIPRGNAYLLDDLEKLAADADDEVLPYTAVGPILEVPSDESGDGAVAQEESGNYYRGTDLPRTRRGNSSRRTSRFSKSFWLFPTSARMTAGFSKGSPIRSRSWVWTKLSGPWSTGL